MKRLLLACLLGACGPSPGASHDTTAPTATDVKVVGADPGEDLLRDIDAAIKPEATAGLYWIPYVTCWDCQPPAALVAYITPDEKTAHAIVAAMNGKLRLGLPYIVHTDEIGASPRGIAIVTGSFDKREWAEAAAAGSDTIAGVKPAVLDVNKDHWSEAPRHVTVIDRGAPTQAFTAADRSKPACTVAPGDLFVVEDNELEWYSFAPVRCGKELAYVPWTRTLLGHAVIVRAADGSHDLFQVVGAECDSPIIETWNYDEQGRHELPKDHAGDPLIARGGC